jgi:hypothetical protein
VVDGWGTAKLIHHRLFNPEGPEKMANTTIEFWASGSFCFSAATSITNTILIPAVKRDNLGTFLNYNYLNKLTYFYQLKAFGFCGS